MSLKASVKYNIPVPEEAPAFKVGVSVHRREATDEEEIAACYPLQLKITAEYVSILYNTSCRRARFRWQPFI
jgi:hypothetical protein